MDASSPLSVHTSVDKAFSLQVTHSGCHQWFVFENNQSSCQGEDRSHLFHMTCKCSLFPCSIISQFYQKTPLCITILTVRKHLCIQASQGSIQIAEHLKLQKDYHHVKVDGLGDMCKKITQIVVREKEKRFNLKHQHTGTFHK